MCIRDRPQEQAQKAPAVKYYPIDEETARRAHEMMSMRDVYKRQSHIRSYSFLTQRWNGQRTSFPSAYAGHTHPSHGFLFRFFSIALTVLYRCV